MDSARTQLDSAELDTKTCSWPLGESFNDRLVLLGRMATTDGSEGSESPSRGGDDFFV